MQETKCQQPGQIVLDGFYTYEHLRSNKEGGGVTVSALKELKPVYVSDGGEEAEAITIDIHVKNMSVSVTSAYGLQESALNVTKDAFWDYLNKEAHRARTCGKGFILQGDLNAWLGSQILPGDCREQNKNGKLLSKFLQENKLICVNSLPLTEGVITRSRIYLGIEKKSTIDFFIVCERVLPLVTSMKIDKLNTLTNHKRGHCAVNSDHIPLVMNVKLEVQPSKKQKVEILDFKNPDSQQVFFNMTSDTSEFTDFVNNVENVSEQATKWLSILKTHCMKSFKKIRIRSRTIKPSKADRMIGQRNKLMKQGEI